MTGTQTPPSVPSVPMLVSLSVLCCVLQTTVVTVVTADHSNHGGVAMGHINVCDDAKTQIHLDWDPSSSKEYTCDDGRILQGEQRSEISCENQTKPAIHVCYPTKIHYDDIPPRSGQHRPNWADYGEYLYVPPQRWLHDLEHGAIVMLYHPCADPQEVDALRRVVTGCLRKHIITPYKPLPRVTPFALLSWGCKLLMGRVELAPARQFIKDHAKKDGPEGLLSKSGRYRQSLTTPAVIVSDYDDSVICPQPLNVQKSRPAEWQGQGQGAWSDFDNDPDLRLSMETNPFILQSLQRRQQLSREMEMLKRSYQRLHEIFDQVVGP